MKLATLIFLALAGLARSLLVSQAKPKAATNFASLRAVYSIRRLPVGTSGSIVLPQARALAAASLKMSTDASSSPLSPEPLIVGMFGGGTVGGGVYEICQKKKQLFESLGANIKIKKICVKDATKSRDFKLDSNTEIVTDFNAILDDPEINCVIEVMGGTTAAKDVVYAAIGKGKHVVTANKALLAQHLPEIQELLAQNPGVKFGFEAAVCGGIPIIHTLQNDFLGDNIRKLLGIMNGTTNFMLTKMESEGADYAAVLAEAQALGYAEADPTADVEGHDVQAKIALVAKLAFGVGVPVEAIPCKGISAIQSIDFQYAKQMGATIKLAGVADASREGQLSVYVSPVVVPRTHPLASARMATNIVEVTSDNMGSTSYVGPGAGRYPTANSVVNDVVRAARGLTGTAFPVDAEARIEGDYVSKFYVRIKIRDQLGVVRVVGELAEKHGVSIDAILQLPITDPNNVDFVVTTGQTAVSSIEAFSADVSKQGFTLESPVVMTLL
eukprot:CAMPEP_0194667830 /NCGR_PEP_ID=MMETSP0295-20121207/3553_1 /TAXON_ID=39354 /ORGANISM="Heterosigma akashiwo, Strain CCMP2393" /LENGTH=498 /DNA_ID=CAMNT_0039550363 /DNA_START=73 /DNA_END=1569 /DNA_ORIENTATION=-